MSTRPHTVIGWVALIIATGCDQPPPPKAPPAPPAADVKRVELGPNVVLEVPAAGRRRVRVRAEVCFREGPLELLLCKKHTKEHEAVLSADVDVRQLHAALLAAGAKVGRPVQFDPKYVAASGTPIRVTLEYVQDGKTVTTDGRRWVRDAKGRKELALDWVFAGSRFFPDPDDPKKPPLYAANGGDVICVSNFETAMLDLPITSPQANAELQFEAFTERIPPLGTAVTVILEPLDDKK